MYEIKASEREMNLRDGRTARIVVWDDDWPRSIMTAVEWEPGPTGHPTATGRRWACEGVRFVD